MTALEKSKPTDDTRQRDADRIFGINSSAISVHAHNVCSGIFCFYTVITSQNKCTTRKCCMHMLIQTTIKILLTDAVPSNANMCCT